MERRGTERCTKHKEIEKKDGRKKRGRKKGKGGEGEIENKRIKRGSRQGKKDEGGRKGKGGVAGAERMSQTLIPYEN